MGHDAHILLISQRCTILHRRDWGLLIVFTWCSGALCYCSLGCKCCGSVEVKSFGETVTFRHGRLRNNCHLPRPSSARNRTRTSGYKVTASVNIGVSICRGGHQRAGSSCYFALKSIMHDHYARKMIPHLYLMIWLPKCSRVSHHPYRDLQRSSSLIFSFHLWAPKTPKSHENSRNSKQKTNMKSNCFESLCCIPGRTMQNFTSKMATLRWQIHIHLACFFLRWSSSSVARFRGNYITCYRYFPTGGVSTMAKDRCTRSALMLISQELNTSQQAWCGH